MHQMSMCHLKMRDNENHLHCDGKTSLLLKFGRQKKKTICKIKHDERKGMFRFLSKANKNGSVPRGHAGPRQIATDPHGFFRSHSIGNGPFNFPVEAFAVSSPCIINKTFTLGSPGKEKPVLGCFSDGISLHYCPINETYPSRSGAGV